MHTGGRGPAPFAQRRRRNTPARGDWIELPPLRKPVLGPLGRRPGGGAWSIAAREAWAAWRQDPVTQQWTSADVAYARDTILLLDTMTMRGAGEVRLRMDGLGLTPKGKRDLRWRVDDEQPPAEVVPIASSDHMAARVARLSKTERTAL